MTIDMRDVFCYGPDSKEVPVVGMAGRDSCGICRLYVPVVAIQIALNRDNKPFEAMPVCCDCGLPALVAAFDLSELPDQPHVIEHSGPETTRTVKFHYHCGVWAIG